MLLVKQVDEHYAYANYLKHMICLVTIHKSRSKYNDKPMASFVNLRQINWMRMKERLKEKKLDTAFIEIGEVPDDVANDGFFKKESKQRTKCW